MSDAQEAADGTNSLDRGSFIQTLSTTFCSEWNGFLAMLNVNEYYNAASSDRNLDVTLYNTNGVAQSTTGSLVLASSQRDVLVHDLPGFTEDSYGKTCTDVIGASAGEIDGRTVFYHPSDSGYDFAIALPFLKGQTGSQFVQYNTFDPSLTESNPVANWVTVINDDVSSANGTLFYYAQDGTVLGNTSLTLGPGARRDFTPNQFGANRVGLVEWRPSLSSTKFVVRNIRYYYDNSIGTPTFNSALALEGAAGNGEPMVIPVDKRNGTAVLELSNALSSATSVTVNLRSNDGTLLWSPSLVLVAYETTHLILDDFLTSDIGSVVVDGSDAGSIVAASLHYTRGSDGVLTSAYTIRSLEAKGSSLRTSYNTFLGQSCDLILVNSSNSAVTSTVTMTRNDGTVAANGISLNTPARGLTNYNLCANDTADSYGQVVVIPNTPDSIVGSVLRHGLNDSYQFATLLRQ